MKIEESNKLIAEFLGWKYNSKKTVITYPFDDDNEFYGRHHKVGNLHFHRDWSWLMQVVEKIESLKINDYGIRVFIDSSKVGILVSHYGKGSIWRHVEFNHNSPESAKIQLLYICVLEFIKWYNDQEGSI